MFDLIGRFHIYFKLSSFLFMKNIAQSKCLEFNKGNIIVLLFVFELLNEQAPQVTQVTNAHRTLNITQTKLIVKNMKFVVLVHGVNIEVTH